MSAEPKAANMVVDGATAPALLTATNVTMRFGGLKALSNVSAVLPARSTIGLVGPNGAGKSTLFGVLSGFLKPTEGRVVFAGQDVTRLPPHRRARLGLVRSFQSPELFQSLTVAEHFLLGYRIRNEKSRVWTDLVNISGWRGANPTEREHVQRLLELLGLENFANRDPTALPAGVSRLVEVGRVLVTRPKVLMLDEPAAGLDDRESDELREALSRTSAAIDVTILLVEHDLEFVLGLSDHVYVLDAGELIAEGTPTEVRNNRAVQEAYLGAQGARGERGEV